MLKNANLLLFNTFYALIIIILLGNLNKILNTIQMENITEIESKAKELLKSIQIFKFNPHSKDHTHNTIIDGLRRAFQKKGYLEFFSKSINSVKKY